MIPIAKPVIDETSITAVAEFIRSGKLAQGEMVQAFEEAFADYTGTSYAVAVNSGTAALHLALLAAGIKKGDEVITTPFSFIASANAILFCGARPVFIDIDPVSCNINPGLIEEKITPETRAVIGVHLYGQAFEVEQVQDICRRHNLVMIEDACQSHGAEYKGRKTGSFGTGCFSFYPTKNMTTGEGGMVTTNDGDINKECRLLRSHGQQQRYLHTTVGYNFRMTEMAAAIGLGQLEKLDEFNRKRMENAATLTRAISGIKGLTVPAVLPDRKHVYHQFTIRVTADYPLTRDELKEYLEAEGIGCAVHYPLPIHRQPLYQNLGYDDNLPEAERASREVLSLPVHPSLSREDLASIIKALESAG